MSKRMLYKHPGAHEIHGDKFDYAVVDESEVEGKLDEGWYQTTEEAREGSGLEDEDNALTESEKLENVELAIIDAKGELNEITEQIATKKVELKELKDGLAGKNDNEAYEKNAPLARNELKKKATEMGIEYPKNIKDSKLRKLIEDKSEG